MTFPFALGSIAQDLYGQGLTIALGTYRRYDPDYALRQDPEAFEKLRRDAVIAAAIRFRKLLAAGTDYYLEPASESHADKRLAKIVGALVGRVSCFAAARVNLLEAVIRGSAWASYSVAREWLPIEGEPFVGWHVIQRLTDADKRRFRPFKLDLPRVEEEQVSTTSASNGSVRVERKQVEREQLGYVWQVWRPENRVWEDVRPEDWVHHVQDDREETLGFGAGLASELFTNQWAKQVVLENYLQGIERWCQGLVTALVDDENGGASAANTRLASWLEAIRVSRSKHVIGGFKRDSVQILEGNASGAATAENALRMLNDENRTLILGSLLTQGSGSQTGSLARAQVEQDSTEALVDHDRAQLEETLTRDVVGALCRWNRSTLVALGLARATPPHLRIRGGARWDFSKRLEDAERALRMGMRLKESEVYSQTGWSLPADDDRVMTAPAQLPSGPGPGGLPSSFAAFAASMARKDMPQIDAVQHEAFVRWLNQRGVPVRPVDVPTSALEHTQKEFVQAKVDRIAEKGLEALRAGPRVIVAADLSILDGDHRQRAYEQLGSPTVPCWVIGLPRDEALAVAHEFPGAVQRGLHDGKVAEPQREDARLATALGAA